MNPTVVAYGWLATAIIAEVLGTTFLHKSEQFSRLAPTLTMVGLYVASFYSLSQSLTSLPLGIAYAIWGGLGIVLIAVISVIAFRQTLDMGALIGIGLIVAGVIITNLFSQSVPH